MKKRKTFSNRKFLDLDLESSIDLYLHVDLFLIFQFSVLIAPTYAFFAISDDIYE